ncbi:MAG TPA: trehalase family glycosidase [Candidatus Brocadiia bacterium]|nr:trehalase family glycosidase [Candidatus Brocadiia bacterium]
MMNDLLKSYSDLPDVWGEGALFAFSGMDGATCAASGFVGTLGAAKGSFLFHTPKRRTLTFAFEGEARVRVALSDAVAAETAAGELLVTYASWHTLVGVMPDKAVCKLVMEDGPEAEQQGRFWVSEDKTAPDALVGAGRGRQFSLAYGATVEEAQKRAQAGLEMNQWEVAAKRLAAFRKLPAITVQDPGLRRLAAKSFSVMRVNTLSAEGAMRQAWSTPDRVPHKDMWLWDSVFHSLAMDHVDPRLSWELLKSVLDTQAPDGFIAHQTSVAGKSSNVTQPPLLAWGVWQCYRARKDRPCLEYALPRLEAYLEWNLKNRDTNHNGLLEWKMHENARCRCGESGLDNSPRFDSGAVMDAVDFSAIQAHDMRCAARIAAEMGMKSRASRWNDRAAAMEAKVNEKLWDETDGFYYDRKVDGELVKVKAVSGFFPLLMDDVPAARVDKLVRALNDPALFATACPVPSVALSEPSFGTDMWRGPMWANTNFLVILGLARHGRMQEARALAGKTVAMIRKHYERAGVLFEFFDSKDQTLPERMDRKGPCDPPYNIRKKVHCIRDYHWTAAVALCLILDPNLAGMAR